MKKRKYEGWVIYDTKRRRAITAIHYTCNGSFSGTDKFLWHWDLFLKPRPSFMNQEKDAERLKRALKGLKRFVLRRAKIQMFGPAFKFPKVLHR